MPHPHRRFTSRAGSLLFAVALAGTPASGSAQLVPLPDEPQPLDATREVGERPWLGVAMEDRDGQVFVTRTIPSSPARAAGLPRGARIVSIDGHDVSTSSDVIARVGVRSAGDSIVVDIESDGERTSLTLALVARPDTDDISSLLVGSALPAHQVRDVRGDTLGPAAAAGRVTVIEFWATWCGPCAALRPRMSELRAARSEADLSIVAVSSEEHSLVADYAAQHEMPYRVASDADGALSADLFVMALPSWAVVDADGRVVGFYSGTHEFDDMRAQVDALLPENTQPTPP